MKTPSNALFELVKSLSKNEKIYFKKFASIFSRKNSRIYIKLFNEIEKQTGNSGYDEDKIKKKFSNEKFIKQLHVTKIYLYNSILKSLYLQYGKYNELSKLREMVNQIEMLYRKGLFVQCGRIIKKAERIAKHEEFLIELLRIKNFEIKVERELFHSMHYKKLKSEGNEVYDEAKHILKLIENEFELEKYDSDVYKYVFKGKLRNPKDIKELRQMLTDPFLKSEKNALTYSAKSYYYFAKANSYHILGEKQKEYDFQKKHIDFMESKPQLLKSRLGRYVKLINNFVIACIEIQKYEDHEIYLEKLLKIPTNKIRNKLAKEKIEALVFRIYFSHKLNISLISGEYESTLPTLPQIIKDLNRYKKHIENSFQLAFYLSFAQVYFIAEDYNESLKWINYILNEKDYEAKEDFYCFALIFNLILHFELKNFQLLEYATKSTLNYLSKKKRVSKFAKQFLNFIKKYSIEGNNDKKLFLLKGIKDEITKLESVPKEKVSLEFFDYRSWLESKIQKTNYEKIVKEKFILDKNEKVKS